MRKYAGSTQRRNSVFAAHREPEPDRILTG
jgi:hypothetical protein